MAPDVGALARAAAQWIAGRIRVHVAERGRCCVAVSGGSTPIGMFAQLATLDVPWSSVHLFQVVEVIRPDGDPARSATHLRQVLIDRVGIPGAQVHLMDVAAVDLPAAAARYAAELGAVCDGRLDLVHLGLADDGHAAGWVPGDPVLDLGDTEVAFSQEYRGSARMTLTIPVVNRATDVVFLVSGASKASVLQRLLGGDPGIVASRVRAEGTLVFADRAALGS